MMQQPMSQPVYYPQQQQTQMVGQPQQQYYGPPPQFIEQPKEEYYMLKKIWSGIKLAVTFGLFFGVGLFSLWYKVQIFKFLTDLGGVLW